MPVRIVITSGPLNWSDRKISMMRRDILVEMSQNGAPNCEWRVEDVDTGKDLLAPPKLYLHLGCSGCGEKWYSEEFGACPKCSKKMTVEKVESKRVPLPKAEPEAVKA